jgi:thioredoxin-dependent peroxiredoxin
MYMKVLLLVALSCLLTDRSYQPVDPPRLGESAPEFVADNIDGSAVRLSSLLSKGRVVLVFLRGYPGYQCPICNLQVHDLLSHASEFASAGAGVILVYPGEAAHLDERAKEFLSDKSLGNFNLVLDPDYRVVSTYGLRWNADKETAYPSTFVIERNGTVSFVKVSKTHGGRASAVEIIESLAKGKG